MPDENKKTLRGNVAFWESKKKGWHQSGSNLNCFHHLQLNESPLDTVGVFPCNPLQKVFAIYLWFGNSWANNKKTEATAHSQRHTPRAWFDHARFNWNLLNMHLQSRKNDQGADRSRGSFQQRRCHWLNANEVWWRHIAGRLQTGGSLLSAILSLIHTNVHAGTTLSRGGFGTANYIGSALLSRILCLWFGRNYRYNRPNWWMTDEKMKENDVCKCLAPDVQTAYITCKLWWWGGRSLQTTSEPI